MTSLNSVVFYLEILSLFVSMSFCTAVEQILTWISLSKKTTWSETLEFIQILDYSTLHSTLQLAGAASIFVWFSNPSTKTFSMFSSSQQFKNIIPPSCFKNIQMSRLTALKEFRCQWCSLLGSWGRIGMVQTVVDRSCCSLNYLCCWSYGCETVRLWQGGRK